jgi:molybdopterin synthase sulfur carrier subunit
MAIIRVPPVLRAAAGNNKTVEAHGTTLQDALDDFFARYPAVRQQIIGEDGTISRFVNVYIDDQDVRHLQGLQTSVSDNSTIILLPAMAGGAVH